MKRVVLVVFCIIALCSLGLVMKTGTVSAPYQPGYEVNDYVAITTPIMDGNWTTTDEWNDTDVRQLNGSLNAAFRLKYVSVGTPYPTAIYQYYLIEFFDDNTTDADDYWQICYAAATSYGGTPIGGDAPQTDCLMINFTGHSGLALYKGNGTVWETFTNYTEPDDIETVDTISASPSNSTPHWIAEIKIEHVHFSMNPEFWIYVAAYDANNTAAGVQSWPPGSSDVPDDWGLMNVMTGPIPEPLTIGVMVLLSSVSVLVGYRYFRKRSSSGKRKK